MIEIDGILINVEHIHYVRPESDTCILISFGTDFLRFRKSKEEIKDIKNRLCHVTNVLFSNKDNK